MLLLTLFLQLLILRNPGLTLNKIPLFLWNTFFTAILFLVSLVDGEIRKKYLIIKVKNKTKFKGY